MRGVALFWGAMVLVATTVASANDVSSVKAAAALASCEGTDHMAADREHKLDHLAQSIALAEEAVAADDGDALAHLALFCGLGKQIELSGLSWRVLGRLHRAEAEIDRAVELAPTNPEVLVAKGALLRRLPTPLGGDKDEGLRYLRRALAIKPDHVPGRLLLARALADDRLPEARQEAYHALDVAQRSGTEDERVEAQQLLASLQD